MKKYAALLFTMLVLTASPSFAADKQHLQMMAEIRLLQEQQQQLQQLFAGLQDTLKTVTTKLDEQAAATRKAMADQTLAVNNIGDNVRVLREKTDETNVRISQVSQEMDALRQAVAQCQQGAPQVSIGQPPTGGTSPSGTTPSAGGGAPPQVVPMTPSLPPGASAQRMYDTSYDDYTAGRFDLAIQGFQNFINSFPRAPQAADAQYNIGMSYYSQSKWTEARDAFQQVISAYPQASATVPDAYYKLGQTYERLNQVDPAKAAYQAVVQKYPNTQSATLATSALQRLNRK